MPAPNLATREYAQTARCIDRARPGDAEQRTALAAIGSDAKAKDTTHFSIVDAEGNRVAATLSVNVPFGSGFVAGDTGVLLNNHMNDFSLAPGEAEYL